MLKTKEIIMSHQSKSTKRVPPDIGSKRQLKVARMTLPGENWVQTLCAMAGATRSAIKMRSGLQQ
ncbi:MAG: hypothetical protein RJA69_1422 [Pseudomonadota bacterium]|jgi:hypothetical protein